MIHQIAEDVEYQIQGHQGTVTLQVTPLRINTIILGNTWLALHNPAINWKQCMVTIGHPAPVTIRADNEEIDWITPKQFKMLMADHDDDTHLYRVELDTTDEHEQEFYDQYRQEINDPKLTSLLEEYDDIFKEKLPKAAPKYQTVVHHIPLKPGSKPIQMYQYQLSPQHCEIIQAYIEELLELGHIEPSKSPWRFPLLVMVKKDGKPRVVEDLRGLNLLTIFDSLPMAYQKELIQHMATGWWFTTMDLTSGYHHVQIAPEDKEKTTFTIPGIRGNLYQWKVMPFGLKGAPATFQ